MGIAYVLGLRCSCPDSMEIPKKKHLGLAMLACHKAESNVWAGPLPRPVS